MGKKNTYQGNYTGNRPDIQEYEPTLNKPYKPGQGFNMDAAMQQFDFDTGVVERYQDNALNISGKYAAGSAFSPYNVDSIKGEAQSGFKRVVNGLVGNTIGIATKIGRALSETLGLAADMAAATEPGAPQIKHATGMAKRIINTLSGEDKHDTGVLYPHMYDNALIKMFDYIEHDIVKEKLFPVYPNLKYNTGDLGKQMGTANFWANDLADAAAFSISAFAPVGVIGKMSKAMQLGKKAMRLFQTLGTAGYNTIAEAAIEGKDVGDQASEGLARSIYNVDYKYLTGEQKKDIDQRAGVYSANTFQGNLGVLSLSNLVQARFFVGPVNRSAKKLFKAVRSGKMTPEDIKIGRNALKQSMMGIPSESLWEEGMQNAIQEYELSVASGEAFLDSRPAGYAYEWMKGFYTNEGQKSMTLGGIIGGGMGAISGTRDALGKRKQITEYKDKYDKAMSRLKLYDNFLIEDTKHFYKQYDITEKDVDGNDVTRKSIVDKDGKSEIDPDKAFKMYMSNAANKRIFDNLILAALNSDQVHEKFIENEALQRVFYQYMTNPVYEDTDTAFNGLMESEGVKQLSEDMELKNAGIDFSDIRSTLEQMKTTWNEVEDTLFDRDDIFADKEKIDFKTFLTKGLFYEKNKMNTLDSIDEYVKEKDQLDILRDDTQEMIDLFEDKGEHDKLFSEFKKENNKINSLKEAYNESAKKDLDSIETKKAKYLLEEASMINGDPNSNSRFSILSRPREKTGELSLKNQHYMDIGTDSMVGARLESEIEQAKQGNSSLSNVVDILENPVEGSLETRGKKDISQADINAVREVIPVQRKKLKDAEYTEEQMMKDLNDVEAALNEREISFEDSRAEKKEIEREYTAMKIAQEQFDNAIVRLDRLEEFAKGDGVLNYKDGIPKKIEDDHVFQRKVADTPVNEADDIAKGFNANPDAYDNLRKVERVLRDLSDRKSIYKKTDLKERLDNKAFDGYIDSIDKAIKNLTDNVLPTVKENYEEKKNLDRQSQINKNQKRFRGIGVTITDEGETVIDNEELYNSIADAIGRSELEAIIEDAKEAAEIGVEYSFHEIFVDKILLNTRQSEKKTDVIEKLKGIYEKNKDEFAGLYQDLHESITSKSLQKSIDREIKQYKFNPKKSFKDILVSISGVKEKTGQFAFDIYKKDNDILRYHRAIQEEKDTGYGGWDNEKKLRLAEKHISIEAIGDAIEFLESTYDTIRQIDHENAHYVDKELAPTNQQVSAIRNVVKWFVSPLKKIDSQKKTEHRFKNWSFLKGIAGSGKTQVVMSYIINSLNLKSDEVFAVAPHSNSATMMNRSVDIAQKATLAQDITKESIPETTKLILIDEVAAFTDPELVDLANKLQEINDGRQNKFKIVSLGDPSQISKQQQGQQVGTDPEINNNVIQGINAVEVIDSLTVAHRSLIDENNETMDIFSDNETSVRDITVYANNPIGLDTIGIHAGTAQQMDQQIQVALENGKSKAIVVFNENDKALYAQKFPTLKDNIFTYSEVAGMEFDQVFVNLNEDQFLDAKEFNKAFYTAISRHKQYVYFTDHTGTIKNTTKNIGFNTEDRNEINKQRRGEYERRLEFEKGVLSGLKPSDIKTRQEETEDVSTPVTEETEDRFEDPETDETTGQNEPDSHGPGDTGFTGSIDNIETSHELKYPSHTGSKFIRKEGARARLIPDGDVIYVKTEDKTGKYPYTIHILGQLYDNEGNPIDNRYAHLGIISEQELNSEFGDKLMKKAEDAYREGKEDQQAELFNQISIDRASDIINLKYPAGEIYNKTVLSDGKLKIAEPLSYEYNDKATFTGSGMLDKLMNMFNHKYLARAREKASYRVEIFYSKNKPEGQGRYAGVPYLVIDPVSSRDRQKSTQYIRLNPSKIGKNNKWIVKISNFRDAVKSVMDITGGRLGDKAFNNMISMFSINYHIIDNKVEFNEKILSFEKYSVKANNGLVPKLSREEFGRVTEEITPLIKGIYGPGMIKLEFANEEQMRKAFSLDEANENDDSKYEYVKAKGKDTGYAVRYDKNNPSAKGIYEYGPGLKHGAGEAQTALNVLAKANENVGGKRIRVRTPKFRSASGEKLARSVMITTGKSLTASDVNSDGYYRHLRKLAKEHEIDLEFKVKNDKGEETVYEIRYVTDEVASIVEDTLVEKGVITTEQLEELRRQHTIEPITIEDLNTISDSFSGGQHTELRTPLDIERINRLGDDITANKEELEKDLETNLKDINPTHIVVAPKEGVSTKPKADKSPEVDEDTSGPITEIGKRLSNKFRGMPKKRDDDKKGLSSEGMVKLGKKRTEKSIRKRIKRMIPGLTERDVSFMTKRMIDKVMGKPAWGLFKDGTIYLSQDKDGNTHENIARHEVFHKIWNEYLTPKERESLEKQAREEFKDHGQYINIEELLAVKFHEWRRGNIKRIGDKIRYFFQRIMSFLGVYENNIQGIEDLFARIESGMIDRRKANGDNIGQKALLDIRNKFGSVNNYLISYEEVLRLLKKYRSPISKGVPLTSEEVITAVKKELRESYTAENDALKNGASNQHTVDIFDMLLSNYEFIISDIFPGNQVFKDGMYLSNLREDLIRRWSDAKELANLNEHIIENSRMNTENTVTNEVKEFLSYVENRDGEFLPWRYVYVKMIDLFEGISFEQDNIEQQLKESFRTESLNENENAILSHVLSLFDTIDTNLVDGIKIPGNMKFLDTGTFVVSENNVNDINGVHHSDIRNNIAREISRKRGEGTQEYIERLSEETNTDIDIISHYMRQNYSRNMFGRLVSHFNSHRQRMPMIGERKSSYGGYEITYINARGSAVSNGIKSVLKTAISNKFQTKKDITNFIDYVMPRWKQEHKVPVQIVKQFLKYIGLNEYATSLTDENAGTIVDDLTNFFERAKIVDDTIPQGEVVEITDEDINSEGNVSNTYTTGMILERDGNSMLNRMTKSVALLDDLSRILSSTDVNGERRYNAVLTSQAHKNVYSLINAKFRPKSVGQLTSLRIRQVFSSPLFKNNIFIKGINRIHNIVDDDGHVVTSPNGNQVPVEYSTERRNEFNFRSFVLGFLTHAQTTGKRTRYIQYIYPNERTTPFGVEVDLLDRPKLIRAIESTISQLISQNKDAQSQYRNYNNDKTIGFEVLREVIGDRELSDIKKIEIPSIARDVYDKLDEKSMEFTDNIVKDEIPFDSKLNKNSVVFSKIDRNKYPEHTPSELPTNKGGYVKMFETWEDVKRRTGLSRDEAIKRGIQRNYLIDQNMIQPVASLFYINNYVNGYHFAQVVAGDTKTFRDSNDMVKRLSIAFAPGKAGFVNDKYGMKERANFAIIQDPVEGKESIESFLKDLLGEETDISDLLELFEDSYEPADGQGFALPERFEDLERGFGQKFGNVLKPVVYSLNNDGIPVAVKYSLVKLSNELIDKHPQLATLRERMRNNEVDGQNKPVDEVVFDSGIKVGNPVTLSNWDKLVSSDPEVDTSFENGSMIEVDNRDYRIQLDPSSSLDSSIANPIQLSFLLRLYGKNEAQALDVYKSIQRVVRINSDNFKRFTQLPFQSVMRKLTSRKGQEMLNNLMREGINYNFPSIADRSLTQFISSVFHRSIEVRYPGSKFVLQTDKGISKEYGKNELKYAKDDNGGLYAEVIVPKGFLPKEIEDNIQSALNKGKEPQQVFYANGKQSKDILGFRIPSSELHSAVALKVAGFYDSQGTNVIIAPKELVPIHGSDFDVDSLFVIKRKYDYNFATNMPVGYSKSGNKYYFESDAESFMNSLSNELTPKQRSEIEESYHMNRIIENYLSVITDPANIKRMLSPISFTELKNEKQRVLDQTKEQEANYELSNIVDAQKVHNTLFTGEMAIGMFMNMMKAFSFMHKAEKGKAITSIRKTYDELETGEMVESTPKIRFNGQDYSEMTDTSEDGKLIGYRFDALANAALDNLKVRVLPFINATRDTIRAYSTLVTHGVKFETVNNFMSQPILRYLSQNGEISYNNIVKSLDANISPDNVVAIESLDDSLMEKYLKEDPDQLEKLIHSDNLTESDLNYLTYQLKVAQQFKVLRGLGESVNEIGKMVNVMSKLPVEVAELESILSSAYSIFGIERVGQKYDQDKSSFPYVMDGFFDNNPHIQEVLQTVEWMVGKITSKFTRYSKRYRQVANKVKKVSGIKLDHVEAKSNKKIVDEFITYLLSTLVDRSNINPVSWVNKSGEIVESTGVRAFNRRFVGFVKRAQEHDHKLKTQWEDYQGNMFLNSLNIVKDPLTGKEKIYFHGPATMDVSDYNLYRKSFEELSSLDFIKNKEGQYILKDGIESEDYSSFQRMFVTYAMINYGMNFGLRNYSSVLPGDIYKKESDKLIKTMDNVLKMKDEDFNRMVDHFEAQIVLNNPGSIETMPMKPVSQGEKVIKDKKGEERTIPVYHGEENGIYFDRKFAVEREQKWPRYFTEKHGGDITVYALVSDQESSKAYYIALGYENKDGIYDLESLNKAKKYNRRESFEPGVRHVNGTVTKSGIISIARYSLNKGDIIKVSSHSDPGKVNGKYYTVTERISDKSYRVEEAKLYKPRGYFDSPTSEAERMANKMYDALSKREYPYRAGKGKRLFYLKYREAEGRKLRTEVNQEIFKGKIVLKERLTPKGLEMYIDMEVLKDFLYGRQINMFNRGYVSNEQLIDVAASNPKLKEISDLAVTNDVHNEIREKHYEQYMSAYDNKSITEILDGIISRSNNPFVRQMANKLKSRLEGSKLTFKGNTSLKDSRLGQFDPTGEISLDYMKLAYGSIPRNLSDADIVMLHEIAHGATEMQLIENEAFRMDIKNIMNDVLAVDPSLKEAYPRAFNNESEFIAEFFSNKNLYERLGEITIPENKNESFLKKILNKILGILGIRKGGNAAIRMDNLIKKNNSYTEFLRLNEDNQYVDKDGNIVNYQPSGYDQYKDTKHLNKIIGQGVDYVTPVDETGNEEDYYTNSKGDRLKRISDIYNGFLSYFRKGNLDKKKTYGERSADYAWKYIDKDKKQMIDVSYEETYDEYKERKDKVYLEGMIKGKIVHKIIERFIDRKYNNGQNENRINAEIQTFAYSDHTLTDSQGKEYSISVNIDPNKYNWVEDNIDKIFSAHGIDIQDTTAEELRDIIASEVTVASELLGHAGTADIVVEHSDGTVSVKDVKTGYNFDSILSSRLLKYGERSRNIHDSPRDRAKLQIMTYAFIMKLNNPDIQFRDLSVMWLPGRYHATNMDMVRKVDVNDFLEMIKMFLKDKNALKEAGLPEDIFNIITEKSKNIFNPSFYTNEYTESPDFSTHTEKQIEGELIDEMKFGDKTPEAMLEYKINELKVIIGKAPVLTRLGKNKYEHLPYKDQVRARLLTHQILQLLKDPSTSFALTEDADIAVISSWIGNYSELSVPHVKVWKKFRDNMNHRASLAHQEKMYKFQSLHRPVLEDYYKENPNILRNKKFLNWNNYKKIYGFAYKEFEDNGATQLRMIHRGDSEYNNLTENQKNFLDYINEQYASYFDKENGYLHQTATIIDEYGKQKRVSIMEQHNREVPEGQKRHYYEGWFPKIPKEQSEMIFDAGEGNYLKGMTNKNFIKDMWHRSLTFYLENQYEGRNVKGMVLPVKYLGSFAIDNKRDYSYNIEFQFDQWTKGIEYKRHMDPVYALGESVRGYMSMVKYKDQPMFKNAADMFEKKLISDVLSRTIREKATKRPLMLSGNNLEDREIRTDAILHLMRNWVSATIMWLRPFQGGGNGLHANFLKHKEGLKGSIAGKIFGINGDAIDYTFKDSLAADAVYFSEHIPNAITGSIERDKTWLLLKKFDYMPDNFDFKSPEKYLLSTRNRAISRTSMYAFHRMPEEYVSMTTMIAQLKHLKHPTLKNKNGKPKSLWDCYKVEKNTETGEYDAVWIGDRRGYIKSGTGENITYTEMNEITSQEMAKLKKIYERMQGGYRKEEAAAIEVYVMGKIFIQLKKYIPRLLLNALHSKRGEIDLGKWVDTMERKDGETVFEWVERMNDGRWRVLGGFLANSLSLGKWSENYSWNQLDDEQKQHLIDAVLSLSALAISYTAYGAMFGDDKDSDTMKRWYKMYLIDNLGQQYNPEEMVTLITQGLQPVAFVRSAKAMENMTKMMVATWGMAWGAEEDKIFTDRDQIRGWYEIRKSIPFLSSYADFMTKIMNTREVDEGFLRDRQNKWR